MKQLLKKISPVSGGVILFFLLFLYGLVKNMSMSYMGNTSKQMQDYIITNFLVYIIVFLLKILAIYLIIGLILGIAVHVLIFSFSLFIKKELSIKISLLLNFVITGFIFIIFFFKDLIIYPQIYMNNFYVRNDINKLLVDFLTDNFNPIFFTIIQIAVAVLILGLFFYSYLFKKWRIFHLISNYFNFLYKTKKKVTIHKMEGREEIPLPKAGEYSPFFKQIHKKLLKYFIYAFSVVAIIVALFVILKGSKPSRFDEPNILMLAADALRPDHFSGYGYSRNTTPNIDRLINEGVSFKNAFIEVPRTFPSWVSILSGRFASTHGIRHMFPTSRDVNRDFFTIVELLKGKGYETSVIADYAGDIFSRIDLGFDKIDVPFFNSNYLIEQIIIEAHTGIFPFITNRVGLDIFPVLKDSAYFCPPEFLKDRVIESIRKARRPFFLTTFFSSSHFPYASPYSYYKLYADEDYTGPYKYYKQRIISLDNEDIINISTKDTNQVRALYDGGIKAFDDAVGDIVKYLSENGILDNTIIIILSDHGENIYENNLGMGHGEHFRGQYSIRIPFIIRYPKLNHKKKEINELVRGVDIAPTILSILNEPVPDYMEGVSLLPLMNGSKIKKLYAFGETGIWFDNTVREDLFFQRLRIMYPDITFLGEMDPYFDNQIVLKEEYRDIINLAKHRYVFDGRYKLIYMPLKDKVLYELYDTLNDPVEKNNIASSDRYNFFRLKKKLFDWIKRNGDVVVRNDYIFPMSRY